MKKIAVLAGDGIGPEVVAASVSILTAVTDELEFISGDIGLDCFDRTGEYLPRETLDIVDEADAILFGTITDSEDRNYRSPLIQLKKQLDLYANICPVRRLADDIGIGDIDTIFVRENLEGIYTMSESEDLDGTTTERRVSIKNCKRICRKAIQVAEWKNRGKVTCAHKADVLRVSDGMFRNIFYDEMGSTEIEGDDSLVENVATQLILQPGSLDVVVSLNLYGGLLSEIAAAVVGGPHMIPSANLGDGIGLFEPMHGSRPDLTGLDVVNPISSILSASIMLDSLGMKNESEKIVNSVRTAIGKGIRTQDLGGTMGAYEFTERLAEICRSV